MRVVFRLTSGASVHTADLTQADADDIVQTLLDLPRTERFMGLNGGSARMVNLDQIAYVEVLED